MHIVLIAHDARKADMMEWVRANRDRLARHRITATKSTGTAILNATDLPVTLLKHGPEGGDAQAGALIAEGQVDLLVFLWDPLSPQPHDVDVKALLRLAVLYDIPTACNRRSAEFLVSSPLFQDPGTPPADFR